MEVKIPIFQTPNPNDFEEEKNLLDFSLKFNEKSYNCSIKEIKENKIKIIMILSNYPFQIYENEFNLYNFHNLNRNFRIYDNIKECTNDLISYIKQNKIRITDVQKKEIILELDIITKKDNIVNIKLNRKEIEFEFAIKKLESFYEQLESKNKEISELKNKLIEIEQKKQDELIAKDNRINELEKRLEKLEKTIEIIEKQDKNNKSIGYYPNNNLEKTIKILNIKNIKNEFKKIKTKKPINEIHLFSMSGNYIESSGPKIFDKNHNLIISFDDIGFCDHICIITENLLVISQKNILILLRIIKAKQNEYKFKKFNNTLKNESIKKIIRGLKENEIITSDVKGNIGFWSIILKDDDFILEMDNFIQTYYDSNTYILLFKNILIVGADKLYLYNIEDFNHRDIL